MKHTGRIAFALLIGALTAGGDAAPPVPPHGGPASPPAGPQGEPRAGTPVTASLTVDNPSPYCFQDFTLTLTVESAGIRLGKEIDLEGLPPDHRWWREPFRALPPLQDVREGVVRETRVYRCRARGLTSGPLTIEPVLRVQVLTPGPAYRLTDSDTPADVNVRPLSLDVRPLPEAGRPADFSGAVGHFSLQVTVTPTNVIPRDIIQVVTRIRGTGYMDAIRAPGVRYAPHFRLYDPVARPAENGDAVAFEQLLVPQSPRAAAIPSITFAYFDPATQRYVTLESGPFPLQFLAAPPAAGRLPADIMEESATWRETLRSLFRCRHVVWRRSDVARFAPDPSATPTFAPAAGARMKVLAVSGRWAKVDDGRNIGWVALEDPANQCLARKRLKR